MVLGKIRDCVFKEDFRSLKLMLSYFKLGEGDEKAFTEGSFAELDECPFVVGSGTPVIALVLLEISRLDKARRHRIDIDELLKNDPTLVEIVLPLLELKVRIPRKLRGLPRHPVVEDPSHRLEFSEHLLHQGIFVPELLDPGHVLAGSLPDVARALNKLVAHLHLRIL